MQAAHARNAGDDLGREGNSVIEVFALELNGPKGGAHEFEAAMESSAARGVAGGPGDVRGEASSERIVVGEAEGEGAGLCLVQDAAEVV